MSSRLDRLFVLLDQGSSQVTRKAAALQLGEVQRLHPHELRTLLTKVRTFLHSSNWDTRIAAAQAVEAIVRNVDMWLPTGTDSPAETFSPVNESLRFKFDRFNIDTIISNGTHLLASEGSEFEVNRSEVKENEDAESVKARLVEQRKALNSRLGLDVMQNLGIGIKSEDLVSNDELQCELERASECELEGTSECELERASGKQSDSNCDTSSNKSKPRNHHLKRKLSNDVTNKKLKREDSTEKNWIDKNSTEKNSTESDSQQSSQDWPLEWFTDQLMNDLFHPSWEVRHGAATGLREVVKLQGKCGGRISSAPSVVMERLNQEWLEDLSLRLLCVLALDKFGDFISDQVIAPVRETSAQTLGSVLNVMSSEGVRKCLVILTQLLDRPEWEARHGSLLGLKYLLAVRSDLNPQLLPLVFDSVFRRLKDPIDDVSAVAAAALVPVKDVLIQLLPHSINPTIDYLWDALLEIDDLTSSTSNILMLLSSLLTYKHATMAPLDQVVPRLWPFFDHSLTSVRKSVLEALITLMSSNQSPMNEENLKNLFCLLYQRSLVEINHSISSLIVQVWQQILKVTDPSVVFKVTSPLVSGWICLMMHPSKVPIDTRTSPVWVNFRSDDGSIGKYYLGGSDNVSEAQIVREKGVFRSRLLAAKLIGLLAQSYSSYDPDQELSGQVQEPVPLPSECICNLLVFHLDSKSAVQRTCVALILKQWATAVESDSQVITEDVPRRKPEEAPRRKPEEALSKRPEEALSKSFECLNQVLYFDEMSTSFTRLQQETRDLISFANHSNVQLDVDSGSYFSLNQISEIVTKKVPECISKDLRGKVVKSLEGKCPVLSKSIQSLEGKCSVLSKSLNDVVKQHESLTTSTNACLASAFIAWQSLPDKLNPLIRPLMDSIKREENEIIQDMSAEHLAKLLGNCLTPAPKVIKNLVTFLCSDPDQTPVASQSESSPAIISLSKLQKATERLNMKRSNSVNAGRKVSVAAPDVSIEEQCDPLEMEEMNKSLQIMRRGARSALVSIIKHFGPRVSSDLSDLWNSVTEDIRVNCRPSDLQSVQSLIQSLQVLEVITKSLDPQLQQELKTLLDPLTTCLESSFSAVRHMAGRCFGSIVSVIPDETMMTVIGPIVEMMSSGADETKRLGAVEAMSCVIESWGINIVPYVVLLVVPMMARMSDQNESVRLMATHCFAQLIQLMPLDSVPSSNGFKIPEALKEKIDSERNFIQQLMDPKKLDDYKIPVPVKAELRSYQRDGVNWLAFLNRYKLHGILCDEMGLGKTLMSICILASHHHQMKNKEGSKSREGNKSKEGNGSKNLPSIVVCPPTLTGHWTFEVNKFVDKKYLRVLHYTGPPFERNKLKEKLKTQNSSLYDLVVASYDIVRNDIEFFSSIKWNYCILDEGHIIKNGKTKMSKAIKSLEASHRLILTGTPIQNNVLELWSLFDFLMPGFLGTERQFTTRFARPIIQSRDAKSSSKEQEAGVLAMEALHRQVLPFILRRMKSDVLKDLPPKIMQDYYCELSPLQARLYEDFAKSRVKLSLEVETAQVSSSDTDTKVPKVASHIFQALQYLRKVCNHPKLVLTQNHPEYEKVKNDLQKDGSNLSDISHAAKLGALKQLLLDCGIGVISPGDSNQPVVSQHRALIFCQLKSMLDIVEEDLLKNHMPSVTYMRLDGSVPAASRHEVVQSFNNDPSIDVLLLTTQVKS